MRANGWVHLGQVITSLALALALVQPVAAKGGQEASGATGVINPPDFNGDGYADLAIGVPYEDVGSTDAAGVVWVMYGSANGLTASGSQKWSQDSAGVLGVAQSDDRFGAAVAAGDFNGDSYADLAIGVPGEDLSGGTDAGAVQVLYGSPAGLTSTGNQLWTQDSTNIEGTAEPGDEFGYTLATGNFGYGSQIDLAIGTPYEDVGTVVDAGVVNILYGSSTGLSDAHNKIWDEGMLGYTVEPEDSFGQSLAAANFGNSAEADLAIGAPNDSIGTIAGAGAVFVLYGSANGLSTAGVQDWNQDSPSIIDFAEENDGFGFSLVATDFGKSSYADLAIGVLGESTLSTTQAGAVHVLYGSPTGLSASENQFWNQDSYLVAGEAESGDNFGWSLTAANFGNGPYADLAIGVPFDRVGDVRLAGAVNVFYGSSTGLTTAYNQIWSQDSPYVNDGSEETDFFGSTLTAANFGYSAEADLVVGVPYESDGQNRSTGAINVLYGATSGLSASNDQFWTEFSLGGVNTQFNYFSEALAATR